MTRTVDLPYGVHLELHDSGELLSDHIVRENDFFEREILEFLRVHFNKQETIIDVGANIGNHSAFFAATLDYQAIVAFEPVPDNAKLLQKNMAPYEAIYIRTEAVGNSATDVLIEINRGNMGACQVSDNGTLRVQQIRLDGIIVPPVSLLKIDVEWYEPQVLEGAKTLIEEDRPLILIEDAKNEYEQFLPPSYQLYEAWPQHKTYLYGPK